MGRLRSSADQMLIAFLAICWLSSPQIAVGQATRTIVVVTNATDAETVNRIGGSLVEVQAMLVDGIPESVTDCEVCNDRVKRLREFHCLFYREGVECCIKRFWRERLTAANPGGRTHRLAASRVKPPFELRAERAKVIHDALLAKLPNQREQLDANLKSELYRLQLLRIPPLQVATAN